MKSSINKDFGVAAAKFFELAVSYPLSNVFVVLGRATQFSNNEIETPYDTVQYKNDTMDHGIVMKRLTSADIQAVVPRIDWLSGTSYFAYNQSANLFATTLETVIANTVNVSLSSANTVNAYGTGTFSLSGVLAPGNRIRIVDEIKEITRVSNTTISVNSSFTSAYTNALAYVVQSSASGYYNSFYVRNGSDQVFKCLSNNRGIVSTSEPRLTLGGQLPENAFIETDDGYRWKYLYTIPNGLKNKFFTSKYMPVLREPTVYNYSVDGRLDVINITSGGTGYYGGANITNYGILTVSGDGTGATASVDVVNGVIADINIITGGTGYTYASVAISDPLHSGTDAALTPVIGPYRGHGFDPVKELGGSSLMISSDFAGTVSGYYPIASDGTDDFRQITLLKDPTLTGNVLNYATNAIYSLFTTIYTSDAIVNYIHDSTVYVGNTTTPIFSGTAIHFANLNNIMYVNNLTGNAAAIIGQALLQQNNVSAVATVYSVIPPAININSGDVLYVENRNAIVRDQNQTETVKLVLEF